MTFKIKKHPVVMQQSINILINVKPRNALYRKLPVHVRSFLKSGLRYKFLNFHSYHPDTLYLREQGCEDPLLFFENKKGSASKTFCEALGVLLYQQIFVVVSIYILFTLPLSQAGEISIAPFYPIDHDVCHGIAPFSL
jgi:hypothetical protein